MAEQSLYGTYNGHPTKLEYLANPNGHLSLVHVIQIQNETAGTWYEAFLDAHSGQHLSSTNFVSHATVSTLSGIFLQELTHQVQQYTVLPVPGEAVPPDGFKVLTDPEDDVSSPSIIGYPGWHCVSTSSTTDTS